MNIRLPNSQFVFIKLLIPQLQYNRRQKPDLLPGYIYKPSLLKNKCVWKPLCSLVWFVLFYIQFPATFLLQVVLHLSSRCLFGDNSTHLTFLADWATDSADYNKSRYDLPLNQPHQKHHSSPFAMQLCGSIIGKAKHRLNPIWEVSTWSWAEAVRPRLNWSSLLSGPLWLSKAASGGDHKA